MNLHHDNNNNNQGMSQTSNIKNYATYLEESVATYRDLKIDYITASDDSTHTDRLSSARWDEKLRRELEVLILQSRCLLTCKFYLDSVDNEVTTEALRLLVQDLLRLSQIIAGAMINVLRRINNHSSVVLGIYLECFIHFI